MMTVLHNVADGVLKRVRRSPLYYRKFNNTLSYRVNKAYNEYAQECADKYAAENGPLDMPPSPLLNDPAMVIRGAFPAEKAQALSAKIGELIEQEDECVYRPPQDQGGSGSTEIRSPLKVFGPDIFDFLRNPELHKALLQFFRGYYRVEKIASWRSFPSQQANNTSWLWHSDTYPPYTCKIFLHLTAANAELGATEFMNREDTMAYRRAGYFGQFRTERKGNLETFAKEHGLPYRPIRIDVEPGDVTIFNENFFHRAVHPKRGFRDVAQVLMLPSPVPWEEDYKNGPDRFRVTKAGFPNDPR